MTDLNKAINMFEQLNFLHEQGFVILETLEKPEHFGYWQVILRSRELSLKFCDDRAEVVLLCGPISAPLGLKSGQYCDIDMAIGFLNRESSIDFNRTFPREINAQLEKLIQKLKVNYGKIVELFKLDDSFPEKWKELEMYGYKIHGIEYKPRVTKKRK